MAFTSSPLGIVMSFSPRTIADRAAGKFVKGLAQELWTGLPEVNTGLSFPLFAALDATSTPHWSDARKRGYLQSRLPALRVRAKGTEQPGGQCFSGPGQVLKKESIGMSGKEFGDLVVVAKDIRQKILELAR